MPPRHAHHHFSGRLWRPAPHADRSPNHCDPRRSPADDSPSRIAIGCGTSQCKQAGARPGPIRRPLGPEPLNHSRRSSPFFLEGRRSGGSVPRMRSSARRHCLLHHRSLTDDPLCYTPTALPRSVSAHILRNQGFVQSGSSRVVSAITWGSMRSASLSTPLRLRSWE
jgi:hypothetical protein